MREKEIRKRDGMRYILAFADLQLSNDLPYGRVINGYNSRLIEQFAACEAIVKRAVKLNALVVFAGDWLDTRRPDGATLEMSAIILALFKKYDVPLVLVAGNHDFSDRVLSITSLRQYTKLGLKNVMVVRRSEVIPMMGFTIIAYAAGHFDTEDAIRKAQAIPPGREKILIFHELIRGARLPNNTDIREGIYQKDITKLADHYDWIVAGDVHRHQFFHPRGFYCGSPLQYDRGDGGQEKGYVQINVDEKTAKFRPLSNIRQVTFHSFKIKDEKDLTAALNQAPRDGSVTLRLAAEFPFSKAEWRARFEAKGISRVEFEDEVVSPSVSGNGLDGIMGGGVHLKAYLKTFYKMVIPKEDPNRKKKVAYLMEESRKILEGEGTVMG